MRKQKQKQKAEYFPVSWQEGQLKCGVCKHFLVAGKYAAESDLIKIGGIVG
jgi:hypothetical protein